MKQLLILSGKGGTGKTTIASSLIKLSNTKAFADCDVDAPNLHLAMVQESEPVKTDFYGLDVARIDQDKCISCDLCIQNCRFHAINVDSGYIVDYFACEGCAVCTLVCPTDAIDMLPRITGNLSLYKNDHVFSTAELLMGSGNSGLLVTQVKKDLIENTDAPLAIIDGSPGIGCPVIASISGVDIVLLVTEPTLSGFSDMERIIQTSKGFPAKIAVCINKSDLHKENSEKIEQFCEEKGITLVGKIPFDKAAVSLVNDGLTLVDKEGLSKEAIKGIYNEITKLLYGEENMKVAIASDKKQVAAHFGHCEAFECFEVEDNKIKGWETILNPGHKPGFLPNFLHGKGVDTIIAGGMGQSAANIFKDKGIKVICGASGSIESVAKDFVNDTLQSSGSLCEDHDH